MIYYDDCLILNIIIYERLKVKVFLLKKKKLKYYYRLIFEPPSAFHVNTIP